MKYGHEVVFSIQQRTSEVTEFSLLSYSFQNQPPKDQKDMIKNRIYMHFFEWTKTVCIAAA